MVTRWSREFLLTLFIYYILNTDHSCSDVTISGQFPITSFAVDSQPADWPYKSMQMQYYGKESGSWSTDGWLAGIPANYTTDFSTLKC